MSASLDNATWVTFAPPLTDPAQQLDVLRSEGGGKAMAITFSLIEMAKPC
jgi:hypothetical protein